MGGQAAQAHRCVYAERRHLQAAAAAPLQDVEMSDLGVHNITTNKGTTASPQNGRHSPQALHVRSRGAHDGTDDALCAAAHALRRLRRWDQEYAPCAAAHALRRLRAGDHDCGGDAPVSVTEPCSQPSITSMTTRLVQQANTAFDTWLVQGLLYKAGYMLFRSLTDNTVKQSLRYNVLSSDAIL